MKKKYKIIVSIVSVLIVLAFIVSIFWFSMPSEERNMILWQLTPGKSYDNYKEYQVIEKNKSSLSPTSFEPVIAEKNNSNITVITEMVQNENSKMLKKATVQLNSDTDYMGWQLIADEGFDENIDSFGPSPLSYLTSGVATNLHTQILRVAENLDVELDNVKVEVLNKFHWDDMMSPEGVGFLDETYTNIIIESNESEETIYNLKEIAINSWTAGEALKNPTVIEPSLVVNGEHWNNYGTTPGTTIGDDSYLNEIKLSHIADKPMKSDYLKQVEEGIEEQTLDDISNLVFEILAVSESVENVDRPYLKKVTVSFNTTSSETWELYSDEEIDGSPMAPTSLEYLTAGTALCLTSQLTLVSALMDLDYTDYRVEQQIDYREEATNTTKMAGFADIVHSNVIVESDESAERLNRFYQQSLSMCFAGEAFKRATDMYTTSYLNGNEIQ